MPLHPLAPLALLALSACVDAQTPTGDLTTTAQGDPVVVMDGREIDARSDDDLESWTNLPIVQTAIQGARAHWTLQDPGYEEEVRVLAVTEGVFTRPGVSEHAILYLMGLWPRCCPKIGLAIIEADPSSDGVLVRNTAFEGPTQLVRTVPDLDGDGLDELVLIGEFGMGGYTSQSATLATFTSDGLTSRGSFGTYEGGCAAGRDDETAFRVLATPGSRPAFTSETYTRSGCNSGRWSLASGPEPLSVDPPAESPYTDLLVE
jgi:hypothetical protein